MTTMASPSKATVSSAAVGLEPNNVLRGIIPNDDQRFLLYFIMGTYFGPDLKQERPQKSALQRISENLPPYCSDQLALSHMKLAEVESVYHYILRKADHSLTVKLPLLERFFQGNLPANGHDCVAIYPQFPKLFPPQLHPLSKLLNQQKIIQNIVFINNPEVYYMKPEDVERFRGLTGLDHFVLDREAARWYPSIDGGVSSNVDPEEAKFNGDSSLVEYSHNPKRTRLIDEILRSEDYQIHVRGMPYDGKCNYMAPLATENDSNSEEEVGPAMIFLPSRPTKQELANIAAASKSGVALTGSAATGQVGPIVGRLDIGECEDSYLFRVSLPGVKRDEREFSCEVDNDSKVLIRGATTTGEKRVFKFSQKFEMLSQNLCPSGRFSLSFKLPGPVDPQQFSGNFGTDGILEGIVMKMKQKL